MDVVRYLRSVILNTSTGDYKKEDLFKMGEELSSFRPGEDIDLNDYRFEKVVTRETPVGFEDPETSLTPLRPRSMTHITRNRVWNKRIFAKNIHKSIDYTLRQASGTGDWDHQNIKDLTNGNVIRSLRPDFLDIMRGITKYDGTPLKDSEIASIIRARIVEGELDDVDREYFLQLKKKTDKRKVSKITPNQGNTAVNEAAAVALYENNKIPLDPAKSTGSFAKIAPMWKTAYEDLDSHILLDTESVIDDRLYPTDDGLITFDTSSGTFEYTIKDGDYIEVEDASGNIVPIKLAGERSHAYIVPEKIRRQAVSLLGGNPNWKILDYTNYNGGDNLEFNYSVSASNGIRSADYYVYKLKPETLQSEVSDKSSILKRSRGKYIRVGATSAMDALIKYTANSLTLCVEYDDLIIDYANSTDELRGFYFEQEDIIFDSNLSDKRSSVFVRQLPWVIIIYPTDKIENNPKKVRSRITSLDPGGLIWRELEFSPMLDPDMTDALINQFVSTKLEGTVDGEGIYQDGDSQARYLAFNNSGKLSEGYKGERRTTRRTTTQRTIKNIMTEIVTNYILDNKWDTPILTDFDVLSRLTYKQFAEYVFSEDYKLFKGLFEKGTFGVRMLPPTRGVTRSEAATTRIRYRDPDAPDDVYPVIKKTLSGKTVPTPPDRPTEDDLYAPVIISPETL